jgi:quercetin dioxygenase-like cupin family protein
MKRPTEAELRACLVAPEECISLPMGPLSGQGVDERMLISPEAKISWPHPFTLSRAVFEAGAVTPQHDQAGTEVLFVHEGRLRVVWSKGELEMAAGDTLTVPIGLGRRFASAGGATVFFVRGAA